ARPPTAPIPAVSGPPPTAAAVPKLLKETEVYIKYGLHEKAQEHLRKIFSADPDNLEAHEKAKTVALASGRTEDAVASLSTLLRLAVERGDPRADAARAELKELDPANAALSLGGAAASPEPVEEEIEETVVEEEAMEVEPIAASAEEYVDHDDRIVEETVEEHEVADFAEDEEEETTRADARPAPVAAEAAAPAEEED